MLDFTVPTPQHVVGGEEAGAPGGIRTPDLLIRSQLLYPLSYGRVFALRESGKRGICRCASTRVGADG